MTSDYNKSYRLKEPILRRSDIPGTPEYELAQKDKQKTGPWTGKCLPGLLQYTFLP